MPKTILIPRTLAKICFLSESLRWAAYNIYPLESHTENDKDYRLDNKYQEDTNAMMPDSDILTNEECARVGLSSNPFWDRGIDDYHDSQSIEMLLSLNISVEEKEKLQTQLPDILKFEKKEKALNAEVSTYLEVPKSQLFIALKKGNIPMRGRHFSKPVQNDTGEWWNEENLEETENWWIEEHKEISPTLLRIDYIDWNNSRIQTPEGEFIHIVMDTDKLFEYFPEPDITPANVFMVAGQYVLHDNQSAGHTAIMSKQGRKPYPWDEFHVEVARRIQNNVLPKKLEAGIAAMQEWCSQHWEKPVSRSTLFPKLSPYYHACMKSENKMLETVS